MNKKLIIKLLILGFPLATYAGQPQQRGDSALQPIYVSAERMRLENDLCLNEAAKARIEEIINEESLKLKALRKKNLSAKHSYTRTQG